MQLGYGGPWAPMGGRRGDTQLAIGQSPRSCDEVPRDLKWTVQLFRSASTQAGSFFPTGHRSKLGWLQRSRTSGNVGDPGGDSRRSNAHPLTGTLERSSQWARICNRNNSSAEWLCCSPLGFCGARGGKGNRVHPSAAADRASSGGFIWAINRYPRPGGEGLC